MRKRLGTHIKRLEGRRYTLEDLRVAQAAEIDPNTGEVDGYAEHWSTWATLKVVAPVLLEAPWETTEILLTTVHPYDFVTSRHVVPEGLRDDDGVKVTGSERYRTIVQVVVPALARVVSTISGPSFPRR